MKMNFPKPKFYYEAIEGDETRIERIERNL